MGETVFGVEWSRLLDDTGAAAMVIDHDGRVLFINEAASRIFTKRAAADNRGVRLADVLRQHAVDERLEVTRRVMASGQPARFAELWSGVALLATVRKIESFPGSDGPAALWVYASESAVLEMGKPGSLGGAIEARHVDLGRLAGLTASEQRVLALIGEGLSNDGIAKRLRRAVKTVESHRAALTEKTGCASRVELGMLARRAGLIRRLDIPTDTSATKSTPLPSFG